MSSLPRSLSVEIIMGRSVPADMTLGEVLPSVMQSEAIATIRRASKYPDRVRLQFLDRKGQPLPDTTTCGEMRRMVGRGEVVLSIDDGESGVGVLV